MNLSLVHGVAEVKVSQSTERNVKLDPVDHSSRTGMTEYLGTNEI